MPAAVTIATLAAAAPLLSVRALASAAGMPVSTLHSKLERQTPLTDAEAEAITAALAGAGIRLARLPARRSPQSSSG